jgi:hypothetical protein
VLKAPGLFSFHHHEEPMPESLRFTDLIAAYGGDPADAVQVNFADAVRDGDDPLHVLAYYRSIDRPVSALADLLSINDDPTEDTLHAFQTADGIAVAIAGDGLWVLFRP